MTVRLEVHDDDVVARKNCPPEAATRQHQLLQSLASVPGVVRSRGVNDAGLLLEPVAGPTLERKPPDAASVPTTLRSLLATVAELHRRGIAHRALAAEHVLLDADGPVLCGFGAATSEATADEFAADLVALRALCAEVATEAGASDLADRPHRTVERARPR